MDGSVFCASCGAKQGTASVPNNNQTNSVQTALSARKDAIQEMERMISYFGQKWEQYQRHDKLIDLIPKTKQYAAVQLLVWGLLHPFIGLILGLMMSRSVGMWIFIVSIPIGLLMIGGHIAINVTRGKKWKIMYAELCEIRKELEAHYYAYGPCLIGMTYTNPAILTTIKETIQEGRADNPRDAINLMLDDVHKSEMEALAEQTLIATRQAAANAGEAACFAAASFFFK